MKGQDWPYRDPVPFSDYSRWERRPSKRPEAVAPKIPKGLTREGFLLQQWTRQVPTSATLGRRDPKKVSSNVLRHKPSHGPREESESVRMLKASVQCSAS